MTSLQNRLNEYRLQHMNSTNRLTHYIGIPAILIGALIFLSWFSITIMGKLHFSFAWLAIIGLVVYYFMLDMKLAGAMAVVLFVLGLICTWIGFPAPTKFSLILFIVLFFGGWGLQFIGHSVEGSKPAFTRSLQQLTMGPMFLLIEAIKALKLQKTFGLDTDLK